MIRLLAKWFIKDSSDPSSERVRSAYGVLSGVVGIILNLLLFALKFAAGLLAKAVSLTADAFNNLGDAGSSILSMLGFRLAARKPDEAHPYGHGRYEYIAGLIVSIAILLMGYSLFRNALERILHGGETAYASHFWLSCAVMFGSILVKLYMFLYNRSLGKRFSSPTLRAVAFDSVSDAVATSVVLLCALIAHFFPLPDWLKLDAWCGILVSLFIVYTGLRSAKDTIEPLLGKSPDPELVSGIEEAVLSFEGIGGIHDLIVHDYGPGRVFVSLHAEVPADADILEMHDVIDNAEKYLTERFHCNATIHMDPIVTDDPETIALKEQMLTKVKAIDPRLTLHDFRVVKGPTHTNLLFDVVLPFDFGMREDELKARILSDAQTLSETYFTVVSFDRAYAAPNASAERSRT